MALLLLLLRQLLHPVEEISANVDRAIGVILEVACNAGMDDRQQRGLECSFSRIVGYRPSIVMILSQ